MEQRTGDHHQREREQVLHEIAKADRRDQVPEQRSDPHGRESDDPPDDAHDRGVSAPERAHQRLRRRPELEECYAEHDREHHDRQDLALRTGGEWIREHVVHGEQQKLAKGTHVLDGARAGADRLLKELRMQEVTAGARSYQVDEHQARDHGQGHRDEIEDDGPRSHAS